MNNINKTLEQVLPQYQNLLAKYLKQFNVLKKQSNSVSIARLVIGIAFVLFFYFAIDHSSIAWLIIACIALIIFAILVKMHAKIRFERKYYQTLSKINEREIDYLQKNIMSGSQGLAHIDPAHPYTHDLDIFGEYSLFQSIDRTSSFIGHTTLAQSFTKQFSKIEIEGRQKGILELAEHIDFRQDFLARAEMMQDSETIYNFLLRWTNAQTNPISKIRSSFLI